MLEFLTSIVQQYGLGGLFISSALVSTIFVPFSVELLFPPLIAVGISPYQMLAVSVIGATIGVWVNYLVGYYAIHLVHKYVKHEDVLKAKHVMDKYGWFGLIVILAFPLPIPTDPITILCGISEMNPLEFTVAVVIGKVIKYGAAIGLFSLII